MVPLLKCPLTSSGGFQVTKPASTRLIPLSEYMRGTEPLRAQNGEVPQFNQLTNLLPLMTFGFIPMKSHSCIFTIPLPYRQPGKTGYYSDKGRGRQSTAWQVAVTK